MAGNDSQRADHFLQKIPIQPAQTVMHGAQAPNYDFLATICGIVPASPGFATVSIEPALGELKEVSGSMPHPDGMITVSFKRIGKNGIDATITLPEHVTGKFTWQGRSTLLKGGTQHLIK